MTTRKCGRSGRDFGVVASLAVASTFEAQPSLCKSSPLVPLIFIFLLRSFSRNCVMLIAWSSSSEAGGCCITRVAVKKRFSGLTMAREIHTAVGLSAANCSLARLTHGLLFLASNIRSVWLRFPRRLWNKQSSHIPSSSNPYGEGSKAL